MDFSQALECLKYGDKVARQNWNGKNQWVCIQTLDSNSKMTLPYIYIKTATGDLVPWLASQTDILANDWQEMCFDAQLNLFP